MRRHLGITGTVLWLGFVMTVSAMDGIPDNFYQGEVDGDERFLSPYDMSNVYDNRDFLKKNLNLFKLMKMLQQERNSLNRPAYDYVDINWPEWGIKEPDVKRMVPLNGSTSEKKEPKPQTNTQPPRKLKIRKGQAIPTLCYFKLCSFRVYS